MLPTHRIQAAISVLTAALAGVGCGSGGVEIEFALPDDPALSPTNEQLAELTLIASRDGEVLATEVRELRDRDARLDAGNIPIGDDVVLSVELRSVTQRLVGFGQSDPLSIRAGETAQVELAVRKPFAYMGGDASLRAFDLAVDAPFDIYASEIPTPARPVIALPTRDGRDLIVAGAIGTAGGGVFTVSTSTHQAVDTITAELSLSPTDAVLTADDRFLVVAHSGLDGGVSVVDVDALLQGESAVQFVPAGNAGRVVVDSSVDPPRAYALLDRPLDLINDPQNEIQCADGNPVRTVCSSDLPPSSIAEITVGEASELAATIALDGPALDLAVAAGGGNLLVADTCGNQVVRIDPDDDAARSVFTEIDQPSAVAVFEGRVWTVGTSGLGALGARVQIASFDDASGALETSLDLGSSQDIVGPEDEDGQEIFRHIDADDLYALDFAVVPGTEHVALVTQGRHCSTAISNLVPDLDVTANEYLLIDTKGGGVVQQVRTRCAGFEGPSVFPGWECISLLGQDSTESEFIPFNMTTLFGAR